MIAKMIVNRVNDWFQIEDLELDSCSLAMEFLIRLSTRRLAGFSYDRLKLADILLERKSSETILAVDNAIVILFSRQLIFFEDKKYGEKQIKITDLGVEAVEKYKELINNEN